MKILVISASPHKEKSRTLLLARQVLQGCGENAETIHLCDYRIEFCRHCEKCHEKIMDCPIQDDAVGLMEKMLAADAIVLATPNYIDQVTASMKALFDRASHFIHCKRLLGKYVIGVVSSGSGRNKPVLDYICYYANVCGAQYAGGVSCGLPATAEDNKAAVLLGESLDWVVKEKKQFPDQMKVIEGSREHFKRVMKQREKDWPEEYAYWKETGWL